MSPRPWPRTRRVVYVDNDRRKSGCVHAREVDRAPGRFRPGARCGWAWRWSDADCPAVVGVVVAVRRRRRGRRWRDVDVGDRVGDQPVVVAREVVRNEPVVTGREREEEGAVLVDHAVASSRAGVVLGGATRHEPDLRAGVAVEDEEVDAAARGDAIATQPEALRALGVGHGRHAKLLVALITGEVDPS